MNNEYELWKNEITNYCDALAALFAGELMNNHRDISLGWLGITLISQSLKLKQFILRETSTEIKQQTYDVIDSFSNNELLSVGGQ